MVTPVPVRTAQHLCAQRITNQLFHDKDNKEQVVHSSNFPVPTVVPVVRGTKPDIILAVYSPDG